MLLATGVFTAAVGAQNPPPQTPPLVPKPFPQPGQPNQPATTGKTPVPGSTTPAQAAPRADVPGDALTGTPVYPSAEFLESLDAGRGGQRFYLFGTTAAFADVVTYYKQQLRNGGRELFKAPAMQQFDLGKFYEDTMAFPPSVVVKDYTWNGSPGYLHISGTVERRFPTLIQIVPPGPR